MSETNILTIEDILISQPEIANFVSTKKVFWSPKGNLFNIKGKNYELRMFTFMLLMTTKLNSQNLYIKKIWKKKK